MPKKRPDAALTVMQHNRQPIQNECRISISEKTLTRYYFCNQNLEKYSYLAVKLFTQNSQDHLYFKAVPPAQYRKLEKFCGCNT